MSLKASVPQPQTCKEGYPLLTVYILCLMMATRCGAKGEVRGGGGGGGWSKDQAKPKGWGIILLTSQVSNNSSILKLLKHKMCAYRKAHFKGMRATKMLGGLQMA